MLKKFDDNNMNIHEGHLGGYIKSSLRPARSGLNIANGDPATWHPELWVWAINELGVKSVIDVGCGEGHSAAFFKRHGCKVLGVDGSKHAQEDSQIPEQHHRHDFTQGPFVPETRFDLVWSCEFVEHVEEQYTENFLQTFQYARRYLLMTFANPGQPGWHHVNCQPQQYWVEKLATIGFELDPELSATARKVCGKGHFSHSGLVFRPRVV